MQPIQNYLLLIQKWLFFLQGDIVINLPREIKICIKLYSIFFQMRPIIKYYEVSFLLRDDTFFSARKRSLGQGNVFTPVYHSVRRREGRGSVWQRPLLDRDSPEQRPPGQRPPDKYPPGQRHPLSFAVKSSQYASYWNTFFLQHSFSGSRVSRQFRL